MTKRKSKIPKDDEVLEMIRQNVFVSHAVTLAPDDYIKKSVSHYLVSRLLQRLAIVVVNEDVKNLEASMLAADFAHPDDLVLLLHGCVSSTQGVHLAESAEKALSVEEKNRAELEDQLHNCSLEQIVENVKESQGQPRITYIEPPPTGIAVALVTGSSVAKADKIGEFIRVEKPAEVNYRKLDFSHITTDAALDVFLRDIIKYESGLSSVLDVAIELFDPVVKELLIKIEEWQELALAEAKGSAHNSVAFEVIKDPWQSLFSSL